MYRPPWSPRPRNILAPLPLPLHVFVRIQRVLKYQARVPRAVNEVKRCADKREAGLASGRLSGILRREYFEYLDG